MPPKGHKKMKRKARKEKMLVTSRLMAISLLVDDYIYKNKPISLLEAKKYNEEIISLKIKCKDTRSLQVVEKLKIFMKSIIKEQSIERLQEDSTNIGTESSVDKNPLKSRNNISEDVENNTTNNFTANTNTQLFTNREPQNYEINNRKDIKTQKKISINITNPITSVINSDTGLVEFKDIITSNNLILKVNYKSEENIKKIYFDKVEFSANPRNEEEQEKDAVALSTSNFENNPKQEKQCFHKIQKSIEITTGTKKEANPTKADKKTNKKKASAKNYNKSKLIKVINKKLTNQSRNKVKEQMNISWIENIKHVREVGTDEYTDLLIEDSFWSNLDLPGIWNANDFD